MASHHPSQAKSLGLPGRVSNEIVSGEHGGSEAVTLRLVEIPVPKAGEPHAAVIVTTATRNACTCCRARA